MNYLYKLVTIENVEINYDAFKKKELADCLATMRNIYFSLQQENQQLKIQISAREEYRKLENKLTETENWLRPAILQLMEIAKQDYYWITDQQIDNAKLVPIELTVMGDRSVKFKKVEEE